MVEHRYGRIRHSGDIKQLQLLMGNWAGGMAYKANRYDVHNGTDAWGELYQQQLP